MSDLPKTFCTTREAATLLGVSVTTAQNWAESGLLEAWKTAGGHRRITRSSIERLIKEPRTQRAAHGQVSLHERSESRLHILIIENDHSLQHLYQMRMNTWPISPIVDTATDGFEALVKIGIKCPDLLITDINMPHIDGFKMLGTLASMPACQEMKILVVSGLSSAEIAQAGKLPGGTFVLPKPAPLSEMERIAAELARARQSRLAKTLPKRWNELQTSS